MFTIKIYEQSFFCSEDNNVVAAARAQMVKVPFACVGGGCGFCKAKVTKGEYRLDKYAKSALSDEEVKAGCVLLCKTHPLSDLELELKI